MSIKQIDEAIQVQKRDICVTASMLQGNERDKYLNCNNNTTQHNTTQHKHKHKHKHKRNTTQHNTTQHNTTQHKHNTTT